MNLFTTAQRLYERSIANIIDENDIDDIIAWPQESLSILFACADQVRNYFFSNHVTPCAIMNIKSGGCTEDCAFCAQSRHNETATPVFPVVSPEKIEAACSKAKEHKLGFCVVSSGRRLSASEIAHVCKALKRCGVATHASLGILDEDAFRMLKDAGVVCYNHNLESSRSFYPKIVTTHTYDQRVATVERAKKSGLSVCCGGIFGVGESWQDRKELCLELKSLAVDTVPINFYNPIPGTALPPPVESPMELLQIVSLFRIVLGNTIVKVAGGREKHLGSLQPLMFMAGANGYISGGYLTTPGAGIENDDQLISSLGLIKE